MLHLHKCPEDRITIHCFSDEDSVQGLLVVEHCERCNKRRETFIPRKNINMFSPEIKKLLIEEV